MHPFIPHLSANTAPLRQLLAKNAIFQWTPSTELAFQRLKDLITEAQNRSLKFYDRSKPITVQADASKDGLGAALLQDNHLIAFASKSLSDAEKNMQTLSMNYLQQSLHANNSALIYSEESSSFKVTTSPWR